VPPPLLPRDRAPQAKAVADVASVLLPAMVEPQLADLARRLTAKAKTLDHPERAEARHRQLQALTGRLLTPGGWAGGARRAGAEPLITGRARPYGESTLRKAAREMSAHGAVGAAEEVLQAQVAEAVGKQRVTAFTDIYDQVFWTKKPAHAAPIGALGNRVLACTYFGLTFVRPDDGPCLAFHVSWHKPATSLLAGLQALHQDEHRHAWLTVHVALHVLDRGTQGDPTLRWALGQGIPYLTLQKSSVNWRRYRNPTCTLDSGVPVFVRLDARLKDEPVPEGSLADRPVTIVFPAQPSRGLEKGRAIVYRLAGDLSNEQVLRLDEVYKARWPNNENPIKALVAVGFEANRDRTLTLTTSRGQDSALVRAEQAVEAAEAKTAPLRANENKTKKEQKQYERLVSKHQEKQRAVKKLQAAPQTMGARSDTGGEHLCKVLTLTLFNALALLLWRSPLAAVRAMTPEMVCHLVLWRPALACIEREKATLWLDAMIEPEDRGHQVELVRLFNEAQLQARGMRVALRIRDPAGQIPAVGS
jgi:hypothetical protein